MKSPSIFILLVSLCAWFLSFSQSEIGKPFITNYSYKDYGAGPTNWWAIEDDRGVMYFANGAGVLEFDGENWTVFESSTQNSARSLAKDDNGRIYAGFTGDIGYLDEDASGQRGFVSMKHLLPEEHQYFEDVWETDYYEGSIIFRTTDKLFKWDGNEFEIITDDNNFHVGNIVHGKYYLRIWNEGLCVLEGNEFKLVPGGERFADERIYAILPYDDSQLLIGTRNQGLYIYDGEKFNSFKTDADEYLSGELYLPGIALGDGRFVLNTFANGAYIINKDGELLQKINKETGLQDNSATFAYVDSRGILWLPLFNGISSVNLNSQFTFMSESEGLPSTIVFDIIKHKGILYAGTNNGVYYYNEPTKRFETIEGTFGQCYDFILHRNRLYTGSGGMGFFELIGTSFRYVRQSINYDFQISLLRQSRVDTNRIYLDRRPGLSSLYFDERKNDFVEEANTNEVHPDFGAFEEDQFGNIWCKGTVDGTVEMLIPKFNNGRLDLGESEIRIYGANHGLPDYPINLWRLDKDIEFFGGDKSYVYDYDTEQFSEANLFYEDMYDPNALVYARPVIDKLNRMWFTPGKGLVVSSKSSEGHREMAIEPFLEIKNFPIWRLYIDENSTEEKTIAWLTGPDGILRYEGDLESPVIPDFKTMVRQVSIGQDSILYSGGSTPPNEVDIAYKNNTVALSYASPFYINQPEVEYQTLLEGFDQQWSNWTRNTTKEYINLPVGQYNFKVKGRNVYGVESDEVTFDFQVRAPWYATWWAYLMYVLGLAGIIYLIVSQRTQSLRNQQRKLEQKVKERTKQVEDRIDELATVNRVSTALTEKLEFNELVQFIGNQMKDLFKANIAYLAIHNKDTNVIEFPYQHGDDMDPLRYGEGLTSQIIKTKEPLLINQDISKSYDELGIARTGKNASSYLGVPIAVEEEVIGVLSVQSTEQENRFNDNDKRLLNTIAQNVGIAIHNAELYEEAKQAKAIAEDASEAKSAFLSTVSHELRTPLTSVLGFAKIIRKRLEDKIFPVVQIDNQKTKRTMKQVSENLGVVISEGERLTNLINDVLDLAKIESGRMEWHLKPIFIQDVINRAVAATSSLFEQKDLPLIKTIPNNLPLISGDQDKLIQVVINLLSNAVKFTDKGQIQVEAYQDEDQIIVEVQDTGVGIAEEDKHKVFERFRQAGDTLTDKPQGTGLGLPICREIIEHHGGIIWMKSEHGVGSTFFFSIPVMGEGGARPLPLDHIVKSLKKQIGHSALLDKGGTRTILVVDDDTPIRSLLRQELTEAGYEVKEAADGKAALDMVRLNKPDLIILDVMMPEMNGFDVAAVLKNDPETMDIPIIILSIVEDQERGFKIGVDRYLTKPIQTDKLFSEIGSLLEQGVSKKKVMVVDEDQSTVKTLSEVLQTRGYNVIEANGKNLLELASDAQPDIIMLNTAYNSDKEIAKTLRFEKGMENVLFIVYQ